MFAFLASIFDEVGVLIPIIALMIPIVAILVRHQQRMAEIVHGRDYERPDELQQVFNHQQTMAQVRSGLPAAGLDEMSQLRREVQELKQLVNEQTLAIENYRTPPSSQV